jgi:hypothetical protein
VQEEALRQRAEQLVEDLAQVRQELAVAAIAAQHAHESQADRALEESEVGQSLLLLDSITTNCTNLQARKLTADWEGKVSALEVALEERTEREKLLLADAKKKSETARQLLTAKDQEIDSLREKLRAVKSSAHGTPQPPVPAPSESAAGPSRGAEAVEKDSSSSATLLVPTALFADSSVFSADEVRFVLLPLQFVLSHGFRPVFPSRSCRRSTS